MPALSRFLTPPIVIGAATVVSLGAAGYFYMSVNAQPPGSYAPVRMGPIVEEVDTTGSVKPAEAVDLAFQVGGRITYAGPAVGSHVSAGASLATLSAEDVQASVEEASAALKVQEADLASLQAGSRQEDISVSQTAVNGAQTSLTEAKQSLVQVAGDAYEKSDNAIHSEVDQFFNNPRSASPTLSLTLNSSQLQSSLVSGRVTMESLLTNWQASLNALPSDPNEIDIDTLASTTRDNLNAVADYLNTTAAALTSTIPTSSYSLATIQTYQTDIAAARTSISSDISAVNSAETSEKNAESQLASTQSQLTLTEAPATPQALEAQEAQIAVAQAQLDAAQAQLGKTIIRAPISGTITVNSANAGEIAVAGNPLISMISDSQFQFETYVSEADLAKVKVGQSAEVALDAYQGQSALSAHVVAIDPAATIANGVSSYKVTLQFDTSDPRIAAGETGSVRIIADSESNVISVPTSAIITRGSNQFVLAKNPGGDREEQVQTGISSADGNTEILSGLTTTDEVRAFGSTQ